MPLTEGQVRGYLENGLDYISGLAVDSSSVDGLTDIGRLIELFQIGFDGSPFAPDKPIHLMKLVPGPLVQCRRAVGPLQPGAFLGGIIEVTPFRGDGRATSGDINTDLLWVEPARVTAESTIIRINPDGTTDTIAAYHGIAYGWETEDGFQAIVPSSFIGTVINRSWGEVPCDVELDDEGKPVAVTLVAPVAVDEEEGFEELDSGLWAKRIAYHEDLDIYESQKIARVDNVPARLLRVVRKDGKNMAEAQALLPDAPYARANGYQRYASGVFVKLIGLEGLKAQVRKVTPKRWVTGTITPATSADLASLDLANSRDIIPEMFKLLANAAPSSYEKLELLLQLVGRHVTYYAAAKTGPEGNEQRINALPTGVIHYARQLKKNTAGEDGAFFLAKLEFTPDGQAKFGFNKTDQPPWAAQVPAQEWKADLAEHPRTSEYMPDWLLDAAAGKLQAAKDGESQA